MRVETAVAPQAVTEQLQRVLASKEFDASERNRRFLRYIVEETLAGHSERIKAYTIGTSVFGRDQSFDPQTDPIVRIEAGRLRRSLDHYYLTAGRDDALRITIPKGSYVPEFKVARTESPSPGSVPSQIESGPGSTLAPKPAGGTTRLSWIVPLAALSVLVALGWVGISWLAAHPPLSPSADRADARRGPVIFVAAFENDDAESQHPDLARGLTRETIARLTRFRDLFVLAPATSLGNGQVPDPLKAKPALGTDYLVTGGVGVSSGRFRVTASLVDTRNNQYVWSETFDGDLAAAEVFEVTDRISDKIVQALAQRYGAIFSHKVKEIWGKPPQTFSSYECVLSFHHYRRKFTRELYAQVRECLERTIVADPGYADAHASLALIYNDAFRLRLDEEGTIQFNPLPRALELAQRAVELSPNSVHGQLALHNVYWQMSEISLSLAAGERGLALNPNDAEMLVELGMRYSWRGQWERGLALLKDGFARDPAHADIYRLPLVLHHYLQGRYEEALAEAKKSQLRDVIYTHIALAMSHAQLGHRQEADASVKRILELDPAYGQRAVADLNGRNLHPTLIQAIIDGLRKAGLVVDDKVPQGL